jgi:hypothetical protein
MFKVFKSFQRYIAVVSYGCCKSRSEDVAHVVYVASVSEACCKCLFKMFICFQAYVAIVSYLDVAYVFTHMLQQYVLNVSVLCCNFFIWMLHMFHTHVARVYPKCFIYFKCMLHSSVSCCKCRPPVSVSKGSGV